MSPEATCPYQCSTASTISCPRNNAGCNFQWVDGHIQGVSRAGPSEQTSAFTSDYVAYYPLVLRYCQRRVDEQTARDVTAETFTVLWRRWADSPEEKLPWLYSVAKNLLANESRAAAKRVQLETRLKDHLQVQCVATHDSDMSCLYEALSRLSHDDQELLRLASWEDLSPTQIGIVLGCSTGSARVRLHRAKNRLRRCWNSLQGPHAQEDMQCRKGLNDAHRISTGIS
ncbi:hypothetical protein KEM60_03083 [Austwickia sp. TVS 96-490-7B]|uniref:RNA polymerase sigma factor n=1 Tax=Austwickia sp. TVS 96-490-7B TaxID=2830843 RepID=UPI001DFBBD78|nr:hypothetical protein [Austwickia sp. TVS 96-490-7B]